MSKRKTSITKPEVTQNSTVDAGDDDELIGALVATMEKPIVKVGLDGKSIPLGKDEKLELDLEKLTAARELARISLLGELQRDVIRDKLTKGFASKGLRSLLEESEYLEESRGSDSIEKDEEISLLVNDFIATWGEQANRKYGPTKYAIDKTTNKTIEHEESVDEASSDVDEPAVEFPAVMSAHEVTRRLRRLGWVRRDGNGGHVRFQDEDGRIVRFGINHGDIPRGSLRADLRHAGISFAEFMLD